MSKVAAIFFALLTASVGADEDRPSDAVRAIVAEETHFAEHARDHGTRAAFLEYLADDAVMFDPAPVKGKAMWAKRRENGSLLEWQATFAAVARGADIGYDTGPWQWREDKATVDPAQYGHFVSIWKKQADGRWKVAVDYGIDHPRSLDEPGPAQMSYSDDGLNEPIDIKAARKAAQDAQKTFVAAAKTDSSAALIAAADPDVRVYREDVSPALGREAAGVLLGTRSGQLALNSMGGGVSRTGDLGYDYGKYSLTRGKQTERGHFLQVWRTDSNGAWKLALDLQRHLPQSQKNANKEAKKSTSRD